jgi:hypothetical protein
MNTKNKIVEDMMGNQKKTTVTLKKQDLANPSIQKSIQGLGQNVNVNVVDEMIEPQDAATIKYLSNVKDPESGQIAQPFSISDKKYQMVRGITPNKNTVLGVYCFDELNEDGSNMIYPVDEFENKIARPMLEMEKLTTEGENKSSEPESLNLGEYKHFVVNEKNGKFKKFKTIPELAATTMLEDERYMGLREFKKFFENRVFGAPKRKSLEEVEPMAQQPEQVVDIKRDVDILFTSISKNSNILNKIKKINNPVEKSQFLIKVADMIGLGLPKFAETVRTLKTQAKTITPQQQAQPAVTQQTQPVTENKVIKTIKKKDIK